jgi:hypothetical protein
MESPKGLAKTLVARALEHPELQLRVERYPQLPGTVGRSRETLFPLENTYRNISFAPYWYFGGFSIFGLSAMFYHQVISPFSLNDSMKDFVSVKAAQLTFEQQRLRSLQDEVRTELGPAQRTGGRARLELERMNVRVSQELRDISDEKNAEVRRILGSKEQWRALELEFRSTTHDVGQQVAFPQDIARCLQACSSNGELSRQLLKYLDVHGDFYIDSNHRGPWLRLRLSGAEWQATGLSESQVLAGSPRLGFLVLATAIDDNLSRSEERREHIDYVERLVGLLREAKNVLLADRPQ